MGEAMAYWLFKSEPHSWSWDQQVAKGAAGEQWDGVRNYQARNNMKAMKKGERGFFYHSGEAREIVGIVEVSAEAHPDTTTDDPRWECVDVRAVAPMPRPVTLSEMKADPRLKDFALIRHSRLSVVPVTEAEWRIICALGGYRG
jgi:predicted RNA-binding protein with PUA-like domain